MRKYIEDRLATVTFPDGSEETWNLTPDGFPKITLEYLIDRIKVKGTREDYCEGVLDFEISLTDIASLFGPVEISSRIS